MSQLVSLQNLMREFVSLGVGGGVTKYVAEYTAANDTPSLQRLLRTVTSGFLITGIAIGVITAVFSPWIADVVLGDRGQWVLVAVIGFAVGMTAQFEVNTRVLQGALRIREMVVLAVLSSIVGIIIMVPLVILAGVLGAVLAIAISAAASAVLAHIYVNAHVLRPWRVTLAAELPERRMTVALLRFGGVQGQVVLSNLVTLLILRTVLIHRMGAEANGFYQVAWATSNQYLAIVSGAIWSYGMPKVATMLNDPEGVRDIQNDALRLGFLVLVPVVVLLLVFRGTWIPLLYSKEFLPAYSLVAAQMAGDLLLAIRWAPNLATVPREQFGFILVQTWTQSAVQLGAFFGLLPHLGLVAAPLSYAISHGVLVPLTLAGHYRYDRFHFRKSNWILLGLSLPLVAFTMYATAEPGGPVLLRTIAPLGCLCVWAGVVVTRRELRAGLSGIGSASQRIWAAGNRLVGK